MERLAGKIILLWGWPRALIAFAAGALASLAQAPFDFPAAVFLAFPVLVWLIDGAVPALGGGFWRRILPGFWTGWAFGFGYFLAGLWWIGNALLVEADLFAWALPLAVVGLPAFLALFYGLAAGIARLLWSDGLGRIAALAFGFGVAEWLRATVLTGFPWNAVGYAAMPMPVFMQSLGIVGMVGMNVATVFAASLPAMFAQRGNGARTLALLAVLLAAHAGYGAWRLSTAPQPSGDTLAVRIVQPSILQSQKWDRNERDRTFRAHLDLTTSPPEAGSPPADAIIWPETSVPFLFGDRPDALAAIGGALEEGQRLIAGIVRRDTVTTDGPPRYFNSIVAINDAGEIVDAFDKVHLVPFGEYLPMDGFLRSLGLRQLAQNVGGFSAGTRRRPIEIAPGVKALPFICYEIIFPGSATPTQGADLLLNVTNDAWFGRTPGPYQHFRQAQFRAVEARLPMVRAANNGLSAVVDGYGRIIDGLALDAVGVLDVAVPLGKVRPFGSPFAPQHAGLALLVLSAIGAAAGKRRIADRVN